MIGSRSVSISISAVDILALFVFTVALTGWVFAIALKNPAYSPVFQSWDGLVSWNRWAIELARNEYRPYNAGYPIFFPGLWSLIYRAQGTSDVWLFAKATLFILPALLILVAILVAGRGKASLLILSSAVSIWHLFQPLDPLNGYMDFPVSVIIFVSSALLVMAIDSFENEDLDGSFSLLWPAALFAGIAGVTKQAGTLYLIAFSLSILILLQRNLISIERAVYHAIVALTPGLGFLLIFKSSDEQLAGNFTYLATLSIGSAGNHGLMVHAAIDLWRTAWWILVLLAPCSLLNLFKIRTLAGLVGCVFLVATIVGFLIFSNCCSYHPRNGLWLVSLLSASAMLGVSGFGKSVTVIVPSWQVQGRSISISLMLFACSCGLYLWRLFPDPIAVATQLDYQSKILPEPFADIMRRALAQSGRGSVVISAFQPIKFFPGVQQYVLCYVDNPQCVEDRLNATAKTFVLSGEPTDIHYGSTLETRLNEKLVGSANGFILYGPFRKQLSRPKQGQ